jgi:phenylpropionate dioxygenase-like ring-hydroxylating dioxygenase large terminal subunit
MTEDQVALDDWYPVADAADGPAHTTRLLGHPVRIGFTGDRARVTALSADGQELRELPVTERFGLVWTTLGNPPKEVYDFPEAHEPDRRYVRGGWVTLRTSAPRIVENFLDMAHFPFVHPGVLGTQPWTEVAEYDAEIRPDVDEVWATNCKFFQPRAAVTEPGTGSGGAYAALTYRVASPFQVMLYRVCPAAPQRLDAILLAVHPVDEHRCRAQPVEYLIDDHSADNDLLNREQVIFLQDRFIVENQRPLSLPLRLGPEIPVRADAASMTYRRWLRDKNLTFGVLA